jgi:hypothetical protein
MLTLNAANFVETLPKVIIEPFVPAHVTYACGQLEEGSETPEQRKKRIEEKQGGQAFSHRDEDPAPTGGYRHWAIFIEFKSQKSRGFIKEMFGDQTIHIEERYSTNPKTCRDYVMKTSTHIPGPNNRFEIGVMSSQGHRSDLDKARDDIKGGMTMADVAESNFSVFARHSNALRQYKAFQDRRHGESERDIRVVVYWGKPGTGKTRSAMDEGAALSGGLKPFKVRIPNKGQKMWFDGYEGEPVLVIDDFSGHNYSITEMCHMFDRYVLQLDVKFSHSYAKWTTVFVTSNIPPEDWTDLGQPIDKRQRKALMRRIHKVVEFKRRGKKIVHKDVPHVGPGAVRADIPAEEGGNDDDSSSDEDKSSTSPDRMAPQPRPAPPPPPPELLHIEEQHDSMQNNINNNIMKINRSIDDLWGVD